MTIKKTLTPPPPAARTGRPCTRGSLCRSRGPQRCAIGRAGSAARAQARRGTYRSPPSPGPIRHKRSRADARAARPRSRTISCADGSAKASPAPAHSASAASHPRENSADRNSSSSEAKPWPGRKENREDENQLPSKVQNQGNLSAIAALNEATKKGENYWSTIGFQKLIRNFVPASLWSWNRPYFIS